MKTSRRHTVARAGLSLIFMVFFLGLASVPQSARGPKTSDGDTVFYRAKTAPVVSAWAKRVIEKRTRNNRVKIWVYFTDKGFTDPAGLAATAARENVTLTARAAKRRAKVGRDRIGFHDIPVAREYVERVTALGGRLRQTSRWLNAASFEITPDLIDALVLLPFVHKIDPVVGYGGSRVKVETNRQTETSGRAAGTLSPTALDYGLSTTQLAQINAPAMHDSGYGGQGVLVCMLDTGYRKDHEAFALAFAQGRVIAEHDFVFGDGNTQNEAGDVSSQHNHGTYTWSTLGGAVSGQLYGPAYLADFILGKTEDVRSETPVEEDNWLAAVEWADSIGADVISSSLAYGDWYTYADFDGDHATVTNAADFAASLGIVVCNSNANNGPGTGTLWAPADADSILSIGAVDSFGSIASFSSRGPTADGRIKPEVCAQGVNTRCATPTSTTSYGNVSGTSLSCPLVGGAAAMVLSAHPDWTPMMVREALMMTASQAATPDNTYGWGVIDVAAAINYTFVYTPGDLNYDDAIDVIDITAEIDIIFFGSPPPPLPVTPDINLDGMVNVPDIVYLIDHVFRGGPAPPTPPGV